MVDDPIELGEEQEQGRSGAQIEALFKKYNVSSVEDLDAKMDELNVRNRAFAKTRTRIEELEEENENLKRKKEDESFGLSDNADPILKNLTRTVKGIERTMTDIQRRVLRTPEDDELESYLSEAREKHPNLMHIPDPVERLEAYRSVARGLRAEKESSANSERSRQSGERKALSSTRAHVERGSGGFDGSRRSSEAEDLENYKREYAKAGKDQAKADAVDRKYRVMYPEWGI